MPRTYTKWNPKSMTYQTLSAIESHLDWVLAAPADIGRVEALVVRPATDRRESLERAMFSPRQGVVGDNWLTSCWKSLPDGGPDPEVQVAIMNARMIEVLTRDRSRWPLAGDQLFVDFDLSVGNLAVGEQLQVGDALLEITAEPHRGCGKFRQRFGPEAMAFVNSKLGDAHRLRGVYAKIVVAGEVRVGDSIHKLSADSMDEGCEKREYRK